MLQNNCARRIDHRLLPSTSDAIQLYHQSGGQLTDPYAVGQDPLEANALKLGIRHEAFYKKYPTFKIVFSSLVNGDSSIFKNALKFYISITRRLSLT